MVKEAVWVRGMRGEAEAAKQQKREEWKKMPLGSGKPDDSRAGIV